VELQVATLCDFAEVREGLLFVSSGGVARIYCPQLPQPLGVFLALVLEVGPDEIQNVHEIRVTVTKDGGGTQLGQLVVGFQLVPPPHLHPGEAMVVSQAFGLSPIGIDSLGQHDVRVTVDGATPRILSFYAELPPQPVGPPVAS
jgi:hypothetical protein